ncbi:MAG: hypothetical protein Q8909_19845 [Bacteroidota bacterium]|nr:hypothetical protein [Bacteroidota bacterium]
MATSIEAFCQSVYIATFIFNRANNTFEGGSFSDFQCAECDNEQLPFDVQYKSLDDANVKDITFTIKPTVDTIFHATIVSGSNFEIDMPGKLNHDYPFVPDRATAPFPATMVYYNREGQIEQDSSYNIQAKRLWAGINTFVITKQFTPHPYQSALFLYSPIPGRPDDNLDKWVMFLYYKGDDFEEKEISSNHNIQVYMNPTEGMIQVKYDSLDCKRLYYRVADSKGDLVKSGIVFNSGDWINVSGLKSGLITIELFDDKGRKLYVDRLVKP